MKPIDLTCYLTTCTNMALIQCDPCEKYICTQHYVVEWIESNTGEEIGYIFCEQCTGN